MKHTFIATMLLVSIFLSGKAATTGLALAASPTPKSGAAKTLPDRLNRAKTVAKKHITKRDNEVKRMKQMLSRKSSKLMKADISIMETMIADMEKKLKTWRNEIDQATTIEQIKDLHTRWIKETRVFGVFARKINQLASVSVLEKNLARVQKRATKENETIAKKRNNDKNEKYENAKKQLETAKNHASEVQAKVDELKTKATAYSSSDYNADPQAFKAKARESRIEIVQTGKILSGTFKELKEVSDKLKVIGNLTPTAAP